MTGITMTQATEASLLDAASRLAGAERWGNVQALEEMLAPDYQGQDLAGRAQNRSGMLSAYSGGKMRIAGLRLNELRAKVMGEVGLVAGVSEVRGRLGVEKFDLRRRFLDVYTWGADGWQLFASEGTPLPG